MRKHLYKYKFPYNKMWKLIVPIFYGSSNNILETKWFDLFILSYPCNIISLYYFHWHLTNNILNDKARNNGMICANMGIVALKVIWLISFIIRCENIPIYSNMIPRSCLQIYALLKFSAFRGKGNLRFILCDEHCQRRKLIFKHLFHTRDY